MFLERSESWCHGGEATPCEPCLGREQPYRNKVQRRGEWEEVLNVSLFPSSKLLVPVSQWAAPSKKTWVMRCLRGSGQRFAEEDREQRMNGEGANENSVFTQQTLFQPIAVVQTVGYVYSTHEAWLGICK